MFRIDDPTASASLPTPETAGTPGYFTEGDPGSSIPATNVRASFLNMLQEELIALLTAGGVSPSKTTYNQILTALRSSGVVFNTGSFGASGYMKFPGVTSGGAGLVIQWGTKAMDNTASPTNVTFPYAFPNSCVCVQAQNNSNAYPTVVSNVTTTGCSLANGSAGSNSGTAMWLAIGY